MGSDIEHLARKWLGHSRVTAMRKRKFTLIGVVDRDGEPDWCFRHPNGSIVWLSLDTVDGFIATIAPA